jgi:ABC-type branched-subunit amino acid transport system ATPase component
VVFDVSATFESGRVTAIIGPNGAGKSTLIKALFGQADLYRGSIVLDGQVMESSTPRQLVAAGAVYVPQLLNIFPSLSVRENLQVGTYIRKVAASAEALERVLDLFPDLKGVLGKHAGKLSGGQRNMVAIGRALMSGPSVLMLDEATAGLSPGLAQQVWGFLRRLADSGLAICVVEQNVSGALEHSDFVYVLTSGRVRLCGEAPALAANDELEAIFLGSEGEDSRESAPQLSQNGGQRRELLRRRFR